MKEILYRLVCDYGYGDKTWVETHLDEEAALKAMKDSGYGSNIETIEQALNCEGLYFVEEHHDGDEEDWDWMDS